MAYVAAEARQELLDRLGEATEDTATAMAAVGAAYELLDDATADRLEEELFRPLQGAYGRAKRTHAEVAARHGLPGRTFSPAPVPAASRGVKPLIESAVSAAPHAGDVLSTLQDSMLPVEVGDAEVRAGLAEVRTMLGGMPERARGFVRVLGR